MAPRDHKKTDYISKENDSAFLNNENIDANLKSNISGVKIGSENPLKQTQNLLATPNNDWVHKIKLDENKMTTSEQRIEQKYQENFPTLGTEPEELNFNNLPKVQNLDQGTNELGAEEELGVMDKIQVSREIAKEMVHDAIQHALDEQIHPDGEQLEKVVEYENQFPALGEEPVAKPIEETEFTPEILNPEILVEEARMADPADTIEKQTETNSEWAQGTLPKSITKKANEYSAQFPALGEEAIINPEAHKEINPEENSEILSPKIIAKLAETTVKEVPIDPIPYLAHEKNVGPVQHKLDMNKTTIKGDWNQGTIPKSITKKTNEYVNQFPALGEEANVKPIAHQEINPIQDPELLSPKHISKLAESVVEEAPANPIPYLAHEKVVIKPLDKETKKGKVHLNVGDWAKGELPKSPRRTGESPERNHVGYDLMEATFGDREEGESLLHPQNAFDSELMDDQASEPTLSLKLTREIDANLIKAKELENSNMYGAAINLLKKNVSLLQSYATKHTNYDKTAFDQLSIQCNLELAHLYACVGEHGLTNSFAQAALDLDHKNPRALYLLGTGLMKAGYKIEGYNVLLESSKLPYTGPKNEYLVLIDRELAKFERKVDIEKNDVKPDWKSFDEMLPMLGLAQEIERNLTGESKTDEVTTDECAGALVSGGLLAGLTSWLISKEYYRVSESKALTYTLGIGALVGGLSVILYSASKRSTKK